MIFYQSITKKKIIYLLFSLGFLIRAIFIFLPGFKIDMDDWFFWSIRLSHFDFPGFYSKNIFTDYSPGYLYILSFLAFLKNLLAIPDDIFYLLLKTPAIISDLLISLIVYIQIKKYAGGQNAFFALIAILFNPVMIFNSSIWGQVDSVLFLFLLIAIYYLRNKSLALSSAMFGIAFLIKPQALAILPIYILYLFRNFTKQNLIKIILPFFLVISILSWPFFPNKLMLGLFQHVINTANEYPYTSVNAYNIWGIVGFWIPDNKLWNSISYQTWGYILLANYWILVSFLYFRKKLSIYTLATLATLGFYFLPTRVHERYLYPAIIFLTLLTSTYRSKLLFVLTGILGLLNLFNLYYVYVYYNELYFKLPKILYNPFVYNFLAANGKGLSIFSTIIFFLIIISIIKYDISTNRKNEIK